MDMPFDLSEELIDWAKKNGKETLSPQEGLYRLISYKHGNRAKLLIIFLEDLKKLGAEKEYFKLGPVRNEIIKFCLPPKQSIGSRKYANATVCVAKELDEAIVAVYGKESDYYKNNGKVKNTTPKEKSELEKQAEVEHAKPIDEPLNASVIEKNEVLPIEEYDNSDTDVIAKESIVDSEMEELLGFDDE